MAPRVKTAAGREARIPVIHDKNRFVNHQGRGVIDNRIGRDGRVRTVNQHLVAEILCWIDRKVSSTRTSGCHGQTEKQTLCTTQEGNITNRANFFHLAGRLGEMLGVRITITEYRRAIQAYEAGVHDHVKISCKNTISLWPLILNVNVQEKIFTCVNIGKRTTRCITGLQASLDERGDGNCHLANIRFAQAVDQLVAKLVGSMKTSLWRIRNRVI